ncbi:oxidoreductase, short chain dehydrogenase/reductase family protein [Cardiosporidium cionae]|uniref:Oxidoreductase, short chain dehydrogenase/reductase family protein n=1 Tax=Cardiosporidium cionae TaxID=476202 RepID=A0ABQ7JD43_9APIC|nr:oxidoreductase, short chain dehydrogenase/reductase family protein [Cardiosporidium cionae]|eukprot:KAF8821835.1 oxidoreductase, short chain dehydrogenase/reductase family protein [Cardiosporidium cionae]
MAPTAQQDTLFILLGASRGYGRSIVKIAAKCIGQQIRRALFIGRDVPGMQETALALSDVNPNITSSFHKLDLSDNGDVIQKEISLILSLPMLLTGIRKLYIFLNSGLLTPAFFASHHLPEAIYKSTAVNFASFCIVNTELMKFLHTISADMQKNVGGDIPVLKTVRIIQISSGAAVRPIPALSIYCSVKAARNMYFQVLAKEIELEADLQRFDIKLLNWSPGPMETSMFQELRESDLPARTDMMQHMSLISTEESATHLFTILQKDSYPSAAIIDVFD